ncbi:hypothetical protein [Acetivibrio mesophilus]|uniref:Uncharacterized protein n=1 Tax=Acetivibrio mesophilus TaxID=2487273 RepID=A0A4Q0I578_9FIRM|nr:hypothetical protein [Acetivibrio mesophilus]ODM27525.1 hypothetical protein A7W90_15600 [Clostridium sp. Bc-iso-3]RXE59484.1 hypothetical protein EFD62_07490 [Acetivibrio mesophilus]HHV30276.1 hypothetical protein [Clostridium sp.]
MTDDFNKENEIITAERNDRNEKEQIEENEQFFIGNDQISDNEKGAIALKRINQLYVVLGWISAVMTIFISPLIAIAGITFGVILNRQMRGSGNAVIIANISLALINIVFNVIIIMLAGNALYGY